VYWILYVLVRLISVATHILAHYLGYYIGIRFRRVSSLIASYSLGEIVKSQMAKVAIAHVIVVNPLPWLISFGGSCQNRGGVQTRTTSSLPGGVDGGFKEGDP
jgi:hypothetical protein